MSRGCRCSGWSGVVGQGVAKGCGQGLWIEGVWPRCVWTTTDVSGTHSTGMHSCFS